MGQEIRKKKWIKRVIENLRGEGVLKINLGERFHPVFAARDFCSDYLLCAHNPKSCQYETIPESLWKQDTHVKYIMKAIEDLQATAKHEIAVHSMYEVLSNLYDQIFRPN